MKTVLITGGTGGIGKNIVKFLLKHSHKVTIWGRNKEKFNELLIELDQSEIDSVSFDSVDISQEPQVKEGINKIKNLDILINAAGVIWPIGKTGEIDLKKFKEAFDINFYGTLFTCHYAIPLLLKSNKGKIINFSGGGSAYGRENHAAYGCSKTAVVRLTENLGMEYPEIDINIIAPGAHKTNMWNDETFDKEPENWANIDELLKLVDFLTSDKSNRLTGKFLHYKDDINLEELAKNPDLFTLRRIDNFKFSKIPK